MHREWALLASRNTSIWDAYHKKDRMVRQDCNWKIYTVEVISSIYLSVFALCQGLMLDLWAWYDDADEFYSCDWLLGADSKQQLTSCVTIAKICYAKLISSPKVDCSRKLMRGAALADAYINSLPDPH